MATTADDLAPPRFALIGAAVLIVAAFGAAILAHATDVGAARMPDSPMVESRSLRIVNSSDFSAKVTDASDGSLVHLAQPGAVDGFIWGAINGLSYGRKLSNGDPDAPYELGRRADGRLVLTDPTTGQKVFLDGFGSSNAAAWARLLDSREASR